MNKSLWFGMFLIIIIFFVKIFLYKDNFLPDFNFTLLGKKYLNSQYNNGRTTISDPDLYAYAGFIYLTKGQLDKINIEHPPFGKYLFGLSIILFNNPTLIQIPIGLTIILIIFFWGVKLFNNPYLVLLPPVFLINDKLFWSQIISNDLDIIVTLFILCFFTAHLFINNQKIRLLTIGLFLGLASAVKFPAIVFIVIATQFLTYIFKLAKFKWKENLIIILLTISIYFLTYSPLLIEKGIIFLINQHYHALKLHLSHVPNYPPLAASRLMLLNQWQTWWDKINPIWPIQEWSVFWPIILLALITSILTYKKYIKHKMIIPLIFVCLYFIFINSRLFFPRYLIEILPFLYLFLVFQVQILSRYFGPQSNNKL